MKIWKRILLAVIALAAVGVLAFSGYQLYLIYDEQNQTRKEIDAFQEHVDIAQQEIDWSALLAMNPEIIGWIYVPDTEISFPVVQGQDDYYYLNHTYLGEESIYGSIFLSSISSSDFSDDNTIIYGHSTDIGGMFTSLSKFEDQDFFRSHPVFWLYTPERNYQVSIFAFLEQNSFNPVYTILFGDERDSVLDGIVNTAMYTRPVNFAGKKLITLSTCNLVYGYHSEERVILSGVYTPVS